MKKVYDGNDTYKLLQKLRDMAQDSATRDKHYYVKFYETNAWLYGTPSEIARELEKAREQGIGVN